MTDAVVHYSLTGSETLLVHLKGNWQMEADVPSSEAMLDQLDQHSSIKRIEFDATELGSWDSSLPIFFFEVSKLAAGKKTAVQKDGLPAGVRQLIELATAVPKKEDASQTVSRAGFFTRVGSEVVDFARSAGELVAFIGAAFRGFFSNDHGACPVQGHRPGDSFFRRRVHRPCPSSPSSAF